MTTGIAGRLALGQFGGGGDLVHDADLGGGELPTGGVGGPPQVDDGSYAGAADGDVGQAVPPRPPEGVRDDDRHLQAAAGPQGVADVAGAAVGVDG